jgi:hypothetical protein
LGRPAAPRRRNTDEVSVTSDNSDGQIRRSALRRTSSSSKPYSPRRVRFEVMGEEVLPTASPVPNESILAEDIPPSFRVLGDESEDKAESEQIEDIDAPPPKRISSSQALRALSRGPLEDDGTQWTTVSSGPDGEPPSSEPSQDSSSESLQMKPSKSHSTSEGHNRFDIVEASPPSHTPDNGSRLETMDDAEAPSDDEMLGMPPLKPMRGQRSAIILPPIEIPERNDDQFPTAAAGTPTKESSEHEDGGGGEDLTFDGDGDELFHFDENTNEQRRPEEEPEDSDSDVPVSPQREEGVADLGGYSKSPACDIPTRIEPPPANAPKASVGSYRGHPFSMPIVSDEIHAQAASLGDVNSFVGSVNGRSGFDESDIQSYRESFRASGSFTGATPKSMTERMMMEDLLEAERARSA